MNILDVIILLCCCPLIISGYKNGFINQAFSIVALIAGAWIASGFGDVASEWVFPMIEGKCDKPEQIAHIIGIAITFIAVCAAINIAGVLIGKLLMVIIPEWINKTLGAALAVVNCVLLTCTLYLVFQVLNKIYLFTDFKTALFTESTLYPMIESASQKLLPNLLNIFN